MFKPAFFLSFTCLAFLGFGKTPQARRLARADEKPNVDLVQYVGDDAGLCLEISGLNRRIPEVKKSVFFTRVESLPIYIAWKQSQEFRKLAQIQKAVERQTGEPFGRFAMNLFGESVLLAVYPRESNEPAGVLLFRAADGETLEQALSVWNRDEQVNLETISLAETRYFKRTEEKPNRANSARPQFYFVHNDLFAISDEENLIQDIARRTLGRAENQSLSENDNYLMAKNSLPEGCWAALYFHPPSWKTAWEFDEGKSRAEKFVAGLWKRCRAVSAGLRAEKGLAVDVVLHYDPNDLPERWRRLVERTSGFPEFLHQVPENALLVFAGKQDLAGIDQLLTAEMDEQARRQWQNARQIVRGLLLGMDLFDDVLPQFRPNWGFYVVPRMPLDPEAVPVEGLLAVELPPVPANKNPITVRKALENALSTGFNLLAMQASDTPDRPASVQSETKAGADVHWVDSLGPYRPAYCVSSDYLIFASSPAVIKDFLSPDERKLTKSRVFRLWSQRENPPEGQLLFVSWQAIREFLRKHHDFLVDQAVEFHALPRDEAETRLTRLQDVLEVLDGVYLGIQIREDRIHITTGGITAE